MKRKRIGKKKAVVAIQGQSEPAGKRPGRKPGPPVRPIDFAMEKELFDAFYAYINNTDVFPIKPDITPALNLLLRKYFKSEGILK